MSRAELEESPLADLHAIASELGVESYRRLRRPELVEAILGREGGAEPAPREEEPEEAPPRRRAARRRARPEAAEEEPPETPQEEPPETPEGAGLLEAAEALEHAPAQVAEPAEELEEPVVTGLLDLLPNGSGFLRLGRFQASADDPYVSPSQIRRCELRAGDEVAGPVRPPRRSERHPSLVRVDTVEGEAAEPPSPRRRFEELTAVWPSRRLPAPAELDDAPFGRGSRVALTGGPESGLPALLRALLSSLAEREPEVRRLVVVLGALPEEVTEWRRGDLGDVTAGAFDEPIADQVRAAERALDRAKRVAERGEDVVFVVDGLDRLPPDAGRRLFGAGRRAEEGGSLTVVATLPPGHELAQYATTVAEIAPGKKGKGPTAAAGSRVLRADLLA
jgi:transcription termination factor Rho